MKRKINNCNLRNLKRKIVKKENFASKLLLRIQLARELNK